MLFDIKNEDVFKIPGNMFKGKDLVSPMDGLKRGNLFNDEYKDYEGLTYFDVVATDDKASLMLEIMSYCFAINDLNLYLDLYGDDKEMYKIFKAYVKKEMDLEEEYVSKYGPLCVKDSGDGFSWINGPWSWDNNGGIKYV